MTMAEGILLLAAIVFNGIAFGVAMCLMLDWFFRKF